MSDRPKSVWVLNGGSSREREVSLKTGKGVAGALERKGFEVSTYDVSPRTLGELPWSQGPEIVFIALHGHFGEDGSIQGFLESMGVPYVGSGVLSSAICFHKGFTKSVLRSGGVPVPMSYDFSGEEHFLNDDRRGALPEDFYDSRWFIKPAQEGSTIGIERFDPKDIAKEKRRDAFIERIQRSFSFCDDVLVEEWVDGGEFSTPVIRGRASATVEIRPESQFYDYESKYTAGKTEYLCPAPVDEENTEKFARFAEKSFYLLKCEDHARVDFILSPRGPVVLEMNTLPGMTETSLLPKSLAAQGQSYDDFVEELVVQSYRRQNEKKG